MYKAVTAAALSAVILSPAVADQHTMDYGPKAGSKEFTLAGTGASDKDFDTSTIGLAGSYGWYISDNLSWSIRQSLNYADVPGDNTWLGSTRLGVDYHFGQNRWRPFVGAHIGMTYGDDVDTTGIAGPEVGLKYYVKPETFLYAQAEYQFFFDSSDDVEDNFDDGSFVHTVGVGFNF